MNDFSNNLNKAVTSLKLNDQKLASIIDKYGLPTITPHDNYYEELVSSIVSQQLSVKAADTIWKRFIALYNDKTPTPDLIIDTDIELLRSVGMSYAKAGYIKDLALHVKNNLLDLNHISKLPNTIVIEQLTGVKGIGEWSAHMFMIFCLGRLDILPYGDLGIRKSAMQVYDLASLATKDDLIKISKKYHWHPYESVASWYLWRNLDNK